jgi:hypothetical protein
MRWALPTELAPAQHAADTPNLMAFLISVNENE